MAVGGEKKSGQKSHVSPSEPRTANPSASALFFQMKQTQDRRRWVPSALRTKLTSISSVK